MSFVPYYDVPIFLSANGQSEYIFAENAGLSVSQPFEVARQLDDNIIQICAYGNGSTTTYSSETFVQNQPKFVVLGPPKGPPKPLATSIQHIPKDTEIRFANNKVLYFSEDVYPDGHNYIVKLYSKTSLTLTEDQAQHGYFNPVFKQVATAGVVGSLEVSFYPNQGNLQNFFNLTDIINTNTFPPVNEDKIVGSFGNFKFDDAYLSSFNFSMSPNSVIQAKATFDLYGELELDETISETYYNSNLYQQQSIPHSQNSSIVGVTNLGMNHPTSFSYNISVQRNPKYDTTNINNNNDNNLVPSRVTRERCDINMSINGEGFDPDLLSDGLNGKSANISVTLKDLSYDSTASDNKQGILNTFHCSGIVTNQALSVSSEGYLDGSLSITQNFS